jgi:hypothetical protein
MTEPIRVFNGLADLVLDISEIKNKINEFQAPDNVHPACRAHLEAAQRELQNATDALDRAALKLHTMPILQD